LRLFQKTNKQGLLSLLTALAFCSVVSLSSANETIRIYIPSEEVVLEKATVDGDVATAIAEAKAITDSTAYGAGVIQLRQQLKTATGNQQGEIVNTMGLMKIKAKDYIGAEAEYMKVARGEVAASEEAYAEARRRLGYLKILRKDREGALEHFAPIAQGLVKASQDDAADACLRTGALLRLLRRGPEAIDVYEQIAQQAPKSKDKLYAKLQLAGLLWESGKGDYHELKTEDEGLNYFEQSKIVSKEIMDDPDVRPGTLAIAELIYLEDFYFQGDYETALDLASAYMVKWLGYITEGPQDSKVNVSRQIVTAQTWMCFCQYRTGDYEGCIETAQMIRSGAWKAEDPYGNFNVFGYSMLYEAFSQEALGNAEEGKRLRDMAKETYPSWHDAVIDSVERKLGLSQETTPAEGVAQ
jgi:tetratricopeptide (TPR) repeat protein